MKPSQARYKMRKARYTRAGKGGIRPGWYYIEEEGLTVIGATTNGTVQVRLSWKQVEQALALRRSAQTQVVTVTSMAERPVLFSAPMVRAILEGRKTQTRRVVKPEPHAGVRWDAIVTAGYGGWTDGHGTPLRCRYGSAGDHLWVRETWANIALKGYPPVYFYRADGKDLPPHDDRAADSKWRPSIFMPRAASRITLFVTEVRIQRLHEITEADARAEGAMYHNGHGVGHSGWRHDYKDVHADARSSFARLWSDINGANSWAENPWVWAVSFERLSKQHGAESAK